MLQLSVSGRSEGLCTIHLRGVDQQVGAKARLPSPRVLLAFWQLHNKAMQRWSCALRKKTKLAKRTSHLSFDEKTLDRGRKFRVSWKTGYVVAHFKKKQNDFAITATATVRTQFCTKRFGEKKGGQLRLCHPPIRSN